MTFNHGGNVTELAKRAGCRPEELLDFSANINPLGPPPCVRHVICRHLDDIVRYPEPTSSELRIALSEYHGIDPKYIICGNGSSELLYAAVRALEVRRAVIPIPCYVDYLDAVRAAGLPVEMWQLMPQDDFRIKWDELDRNLQPGDLVIAGYPNNPNGRTFDRDGFLSVLQEYQQATFIVDEAFADFLDTPDSFVAAAADYHNLLVLRSMTKFYAIPGLRLGYAVGSPRLLKRLRKFLPSWSVNSLAQVVGAAVLKEQQYCQESRTKIRTWREELTSALSGLEKLHVFSSEVNFLLVRLESEELDADRLFELLLQRRIAIRSCSNVPGLDRRYFRVAVRRPEENCVLIQALRGILTKGKDDTFTVPAFVSRSRLARAVMFQGTASNVGKSVLAAGFCRVLLQDGYRVAPFKAQNMSLNSYVTRDGGEMGRAQVLQAQACRVDPDVRMNPVLLKPNSHTGAQVILLGKPVGNMEVTQFIHFKQHAFVAVKKAYDELARDYDVIVIEGAGSPAEVNLKHHDIVNMAMANYANADVYIIGDIDRGGVFASLVGTFELIDEADRRRIAGFIINRFRGRRDLLESAIGFVENRTGVPVCGVVPYIYDLELPDEDSVSLKDWNAERAEQAVCDGKCVEIALVDLPHISNFTDIDPLRIEPDVTVRIVRHPKHLGNPDAIILPGSKNVLNDLEFVYSSGLAERIVSMVREGTTVVVGVCGGFQMLGKVIRDPAGIESDCHQANGLGLLPLSTELSVEKILTQARARHIRSGLSLHGYEIHHGRTFADGLQPAFVRSDGMPIGYESSDGGVWGTYLHGLFDDDAFRRWFIDDLRTRKGLKRLGSIQASYDIEPAIDRLADVLRETLDVSMIYRKLGLQ